MRENVFTSGEGRVQFHFKADLLPIAVNSFMPKDEPARKMPLEVWGDLPSQEERKGQGAVDRAGRTLVLGRRDSTGRLSVHPRASTIKMHECSRHA